MVAMVSGVISGPRDLAGMGESSERGDTVTSPVTGSSSNGVPVVIGRDAAQHTAAIEPLPGVALARGRRKALHDDAELVDRVEGVELRRPRVAACLQPLFFGLQNLLQQETRRCAVATLG